MMAEIAWLSIAVVLSLAAVVLMVGTHRRKDSLGPLVSLMLLLSAGFPAAVYSVISG